MTKGGLNTGQLCLSGRQCWADSCPYLHCQSWKYFNTVTRWDHAVSDHTDLVFSSILSTIFHKHIVSAWFISWISLAWASCPSQDQSKKKESKCFYWNYSWQDHTVVILLEWKNYIKPENTMCASGQNLGCKERQNDSPLPDVGSKGWCTQ